MSWFEDLRVYCNKILSIGPKRKECDELTLLLDSLAGGYCQVETYIDQNFLNKLNDEETWRLIFLFSQRASHGLQKLEEAGKLSFDSAGEAARHALALATIQFIDERANKLVGVQA